MGSPDGLSVLIRTHQRSLSPPGEGTARREPSASAGQEEPGRGRRGRSGQNGQRGSWESLGDPPPPPLGLSFPNRTSPEPDHAGTLMWTPAACRL